MQESMDSIIASFIVFSVFGLYLIMWYFIIRWIVRFFRRVITEVRADERARQQNR